MSKTLEIGETGHGITRAADMALGKQIMERLIFHYPLHNWGVEVNHESGHAVVRLIYKDFEGTARVSNYGHVKFIQNLQTPDAIDQFAKQSGGEWLERYGLARGKAQPHAILDAHSNKLDLSVA